MMNPENHFDIFDKILCDLHNRYDWFALRTPRRSITNTEMFWMYCYLQFLKPRFLFESGVLHGRSSVIFSEIMKNRGEVIAARFQYPSDPAELHPFSEPNLSIVPGRGEEIVQTLSREEPFIAVVDGPKPLGELTGRPGWDQLMAELAAFPNLLAIFQHDVDHTSSRKKVEATCASILPQHVVRYIPKYFIERYPLYGNYWEGGPNVCIIMRNGSRLMT